MKKKIIWIVRKKKNTKNKEIWKPSTKKIEKYLTISLNLFLNFLHKSIIFPLIFHTDGKIDGVLNKK